MGVLEQTGEAFQANELVVLDSGSHVVASPNSSTSNLVGKSPSLET